MLIWACAQCLKEKKKKVEAFPHPLVCDMFHMEVLQENSTKSWQMTMWSIVASFCFLLPEKGHKNIGLR